MAKVKRSSLTEDDIRAIRASTENNKVLALHYHVSEVTIWSIRHGRTWKNVK